MPCCVCKHPAFAQSHTSNVVMAAVLCIGSRGICTSAGTPAVQIPWYLTTRFEHEHSQLSSTANNCTAQQLHSVHCDASHVGAWRKVPASIVWALHACRMLKVAMRCCGVCRLALVVQVYFQQLVPTSVPACCPGRVAPMFGRQ